MWRETKMSKNLDNIVEKNLNLISDKDGGRASTPLTLSRHSDKVMISWAAGVLPLLEAVVAVTPAKRKGESIGMRERFQRVAIVEAEPGVFAVKPVKTANTGANGERMKVSKQGERFKVVCYCKGEEFDAVPAKVADGFAVTGGYVLTAK